MANVLPKIKFSEWAKDPKTGMLMLMGGLLTLFVYAWLHSKNESHSDCEEEKRIWQNMYMTEKHINDSFKMEMIVKDRTTYQILETTDSILKEKTNAPVNSILQKVK